MEKCLAYCTNCMQNSGVGVVQYAKLHFCCIAKRESDVQGPTVKNGWWVIARLLHFTKVNNQF